jgi:hypothetical protein
MKQVPAVSAKQKKPIMKTVHILIRLALLMLLFLHQRCRGSINPVKGTISVMVTVEKMVLIPDLLY